MVAFPVLILEGFIATINTLKDMQLIDDQFSRTTNRTAIPTHTTEDAIVIFVVDNEKMAQTVAATITMMIHRNYSVGVISKPGATFDTLAFIGVKPSVVRLIEQFDEEEMQSQVIGIISNHAAVKEREGTKLTVTFVTRCDAPMNMWHPPNVTTICVNVNSINATHGMAESYLLGVNFDAGHHLVEHSMPDKYEYEIVDMLLTLEVPTIAFLSRQTYDLMCVHTQNTITRQDLATYIVIGNSVRIEDDNTGVTFRMPACKGIFDYTTGYISTRAKMRVLKFLLQYTTYVFSDDISIINMCHTTKPPITYSATTELIGLIYNDSEKFFYSESLIQAIDKRHSN